MAFRPVQRKKSKPETEPKKTIEIQRPKIVIDVQSRWDSGEKVRKGKGLTKSWRDDWG